jgi:hypothetical protein
MNVIKASIHAKGATKKWKCPICDKRAYDLMIDSYILELMNLDKTANEIVFKENGEPEMIQGAEEEKESEDEKDHNYEETQKQEVINLDDSPVAEQHRGYGGMEVDFLDKQRQYNHQQLGLYLQETEWGGAAKRSRGVEEEVDGSGKKKRKLNNGTYEWVSERYPKMDKPVSASSVIDLSNSDEEEKPRAKFAEMSVRRVERQTETLVQKKMAQVGVVDRQPKGNEWPSMREKIIWNFGHPRQVSLPLPARPALTVSNSSMGIPIIEIDSD